MKLAFVTTNSHKVKEAQKILDKFGIELEQASVDYAENHDDSIENIAKDAAKKMAEDLNKPVIVEDSGLFFEAYDNFPGALPKFVIKSLGYKGILKLLENESRKAYFKVALGYCEPGQAPIIFEGYLHGSIANQVYDEDKDCMDYDRVFIPEGFDVTASGISTEEKNKISHRGEAFRKLGEYLAKK